MNHRGGGDEGEDEEENKVNELEDNEGGPFYGDRVNKPFLVGCSKLGSGYSL